MKISVRSGKVLAENAHDLLIRSFLYFIKRKKPSIFLGVCENDFIRSPAPLPFVEYCPQKHTVKQIRQLLADLKKQWLTSEDKKTAGLAKSQLKERG